MPAVWLSKLMKPSSFLSLTRQLPTSLILRCFGLQPVLHRLPTCSSEIELLGASCQFRSNNWVSSDSPALDYSAFEQRRHFHRTGPTRSKDDGEGVSDSWPSSSRTKDLLTWKFKLCNPYGTVSVRADRPVKIDRIDVLAHPGGDYAAFNLMGDDVESNTDIEKLIKVGYNEEGNRLSLEDVGRGTSLDERWVLEIPPYYDLDVVHCGDKNDTVEILGVENNVVSVRATGNIYVHKVKSKDVTLQSEKGTIRSTSVLQGNVNVRTEGDKGFTADRLQGTNFDVCTDDGDVQCKDLYGETSVFESRSGAIHLGNLTGECSVATQGDVNIENLDGAIDADVYGAGSFTGYLVRPERVSIKTERGDIAVGFPPDVQCHLDLSACDITLPPDISMNITEKDGLQSTQGAVNGGGPLMVASSTGGSIHISVKSWFDSLKLSGG